MTEKEFIVTVVCLTLAFLAVVLCITTYMKDNLNVKTKTKYRELENEITLNSSNNNKKIRKYPRPKDTFSKNNHNLN